MANNFLIFEFDPSKKDNLFRKIITRIKQISGIFVKGQSSSNNGLNEDILDEITPTLSISAIPNNGYLAPLVDAYGNETKETWTLNYTISTVIKLNRFPSTVFIPDLKKLAKNGKLDRTDFFYHKSFPIKKKRTDLSVFSYGQNYYNKEIIRWEEGIDENGNSYKYPVYEKKLVTKPLGTIEFGAMAPYFKDSKKPSNLFSLCVYINLGKTRYSLYTDYKFKLGSINKIDFTIETILPTDDNEKWMREIKLFVNGEQQNVARYNGKVWNKHKKEIETGIIASSPGFTQYDNRKKLEVNDRYIDYMEIPTEYLMFLNKIECSPINRHSNPKTLSSKDLSSLNNGIDFGPINIYSSTIVKEKEPPKEVSFEETNIAKDI